MKVLRNFDYLPNTEQAEGLLQELSKQSVSDPSRLVDKPLILYGAGNLGRMAKNYFDRINISVTGVVDKNAKNFQVDPFWEGTEILHPDEVSKKKQQQSLLAICIANICYTSLENELRHSGWDDTAHFYDIAEAYRDRHPLSNGWFCTELSQQLCDEIVNVMQQWNDDLSRAYHLQFIAWRHLRQEWIFPDALMMIENRYLIPEVKAVIHDHECFVDIGAHHGEASLALLDAVNFKFNQLLVFEPDNKNRRVLKARFAQLTSLGNKKVSVNRRSVGTSVFKQAFFEGADYASQLSKLGSNLVDVVSIDSLDIKVSFMKLHLEGAELDALQGAKQTLIENRPIVVTTSYHNQLGLAAMALWLMNTFSAYRFFYRSHSGCGTGAVIYAIPEERYLNEK